MPLRYFSADAMRMWRSDGVEISSSWKSAGCQSRRNDDTLLPFSASTLIQPHLLHLSFLLAAEGELGRRSYGVNVLHHDKCLAGDEALELLNKCLPQDRGMRLEHLCKQLANKDRVASDTVENGIGPQPRTVVVKLIFLVFLLDHLYPGKARGRQGRRAEVERVFNRTSTFKGSACEGGRT